MTTICKPAFDKMCPEIAGYIDYLRSGEHRICNDNLALCDLLERTFCDENIHVETGLLEKYIRFGRYWPFKLFPWEKFHLALTCCTFDSNGFARWMESFNELGRGTGKNAYMAFLTMCLTSKAHGIKNYDISIIANAEDQAKRSFDDFYDVLEDHKGLMETSWKWNKVEITNLGTRSTIQYMTSGTKTKDGYRPGALFFDEVHAYENDANVRTSESGLGKIFNPRIFKFTSDGYVRGSVLDELKEKSDRILKGDWKDNGFLPFICRLNNDEDVHNPLNWTMPNPSYIYLPNLQRETEREYMDWQQTGNGGNEFMTKRMNRPTGKVEDEVVSWEHIKATRAEPSDPTGKPCSFGIDFATVNDFVSAGILFKTGDFNDYLCHHWYCRKSADAKRIKFPIDDEVRKGRITVVDGEEIDPELVVLWLLEQAKKYNLRLLIGALDDYRYSIMKNALTKYRFEPRKKGEKGGNITLYRPSDIMKSAPRIISTLTRERLRVGDDAFFRWSINNTKRVYDQHGNITFGKIEPKSRKTDGFMAYVAADIAYEGMPPVAPLGGMPVMTF